MVSRYQIARITSSFEDVGIFSTYCYTSLHLVYLFACQDLYLPQFVRNESKIKSGMLKTQQRVKWPAFQICQPFSTVKKRSYNTRNCPINRGGVIGKCSTSSLSYSKLKVNSRCPYICVRMCLELTEKQLQCMTRIYNIYFSYEDLYRQHVIDWALSYRYEKFCLTRNTIIS